MGPKMDIIAVRIGDKYGPEYEEYLNKKLSKYNILWIREPYHPKVTLQWNKMWGMQLDQDEPICVIDIDVLLINDYEGNLFNINPQNGNVIWKKKLRLR